MKQQIPFSILDLAPILKDSTAAQAFLNTLDLARHAEKWVINVTGWRTS